MTPTMEEVAGWLREAAELAYLVSLRDGGARDKTILSQHCTKKREIFNDRAALVEAMWCRRRPNHTLRRTGGWVGGISLSSGRIRERSI